MGSEKIINAAMSPIKGAIKQPHISSSGIWAKIKIFFGNFLTLEHWYYWAVLIGILLIVFFAYKWFKNKKQDPGLDKLKKELEPKEKKVPKVKQKSYPKSLLKKIWKEFLRKIPYEFRQYIRFYQPFIVLGDSKVGKSFLINNYTDWQGHSRQFYPSYVVDPNLQIYLGSKVIVQEIPPDLLNDTTKDIAKAFKKLWKQLVKQPDPKVLIVANAKDLLANNSEVLEKQFQLIRGKINILNRIYKRPIQTSITLTFMNEVEGYDEFAKYLNENNIPLKLNLSDNLNNLNTILEPYEKYLPHILTTSSSNDYLKVISFFKKVSEIFTALSHYLVILNSQEPFSQPPDINYLYFVSSTEVNNEISKPFETKLPETDIRKFNPILKHKIAALAITVVALIGFIHIGVTENRWFANFNDAISKMKKSIYHDSYTNMNASEQKVLELVEINDKTNYFKYLPFLNPKNIVKKKTCNMYLMLRNDLLLSKLRYYQKHNQNNQVVFLLGILYARHNTDLSELIQRNIDVISKSVEIPQLIVNQIIMHHQINCHGKDFGDDYDPNNPIPSMKNFDFSNLDWNQMYLPQIVAFMQKMKIVLKREYLSKEFLAILRQEAAALNLNLDKYKKNELSAEILGFLQHETNLNILIYKDSINFESLKTFISLINNSFIKPLKINEMGLSSFLEYVGGVVKSKSLQGKSFKFKINNLTFLFNTENWNKLLLRSHLFRLFHEFMNSKANDIEVFFSKNDKFYDISMNQSNQGKLFFTGKGQISGYYTKDAFFANIKPALINLQKIMKDLPVDAVTKEHFENYIFEVLGKYASNYAKANKKYYMSFNIKADSAESLQIILNQMQFPSSEFQTFLMKVKDNTNLGLTKDKENKNNRYLIEFSNQLKEFRFLDMVFHQKGGIYPEFNKYIAIIKQMEKDLSGEEEKVNQTGTGTGTASKLKQTLSPLGCLSLSIYLKEKSSYRNLFNNWANNIGIDTKFKKLFIEPAQQAFSLGLPEIGQNIETVWNDLKKSYVLLLTNNFPFNIHATKDITFDELNSALNPNGIFWKKFNSLLAPVCKKQGDNWKLRSSRFGVLNLPDDMVKTVNAMERLSKQLWNSKGDPIAIDILIKPSLLPPVNSDKVKLVLSYLRSGDSIVYGFNQKPIYQNFKIKWWEEQIASVGVEFVKLPDYIKAYKDITISKSNWSFYHLLLKADISDNKIFKWKIKKLNDEPDIFNNFDIEFTINKVPWGRFHLN